MYLSMVALTILELAYEIIAKKFSRNRALEVWGNFTVYIPNILVARLTAGGFWLIIFYFLKGLIPWSIPINIWTIILLFFAVEFVYYWEHRIEHRVRIFWAYHSVHHSSPIFNLTTSYRVLFTEEFTGPIFFVPLVLAGFHPVMVLLMLAFILIYQSWIHTEHIGKLGILEGILNTPSNHRVHHGTQEKYLDKNYGAVLMLWDRIFKTYQAEEEVPVYGLTKQIESVNPLKTNFSEYINIYHDLKRATRWAQVKNALFAPPGAVIDERPEYTLTDLSRNQEASHENK